MPIRPYLHDQVFSPELLKIMGETLVQACEALGLDRKDPTTELVASHIIDLARGGVHTKTALYSSTIAAFRSKLQ